MIYEEINSQSILDYTAQPEHKDFAQWLEVNPEFKGGTIIEDLDGRRLFVLPSHFPMPIKTIFEGNSLTPEEVFDKWIETLAKERNA